MKTIEFFNDPQEPSMTELVNWFLIEYTDLADEMKNCDHAVTTNEPNAYHVEGSIWTHTMMVCQEARDGHKINKLSALLHDIGKPMAREVIPIDAPKPSINGEERASKPIIDTSRSQKTHFRSHEGISFWKAIDPLYELKRLGVIDNNEMNEILHIISLHGVLFNRIKNGVEHKPEQVTHMFEEVEKYNRFISQTRNDSLGRFYLVGAGSRSNNAELLGKTLYNSEVFENNRKPESLKPDSAPFVHVLVGLPCSGKSTFLKDNFTEEITVISKDNVIMEMGVELGLTEYSDIYKALTKEQHDQAYKKTIYNFQEARKAGKEIVIDMTNMSKKSRGKWINDLRKTYKTKAWVFLAGESVLKSRNILRTQFENKFIPDYVYENMMKSFLVPTLFEFDFVEYVHQDERSNFEIK